MTTARKPRRKELGLSLDDYERLLEAQGGMCALCGNPPKSRRLDVDHDHRTGLIRGLLCGRCNRATPSERLLPATWDLRLWARHVALYAQGSPSSGTTVGMMRTLDAINARVQDERRG